MMWWTIRIRKNWSGNGRKYDKSEKYQSLTVEEMSVKYRGLAQEEKMKLIKVNCVNKEDEVNKIEYLN